MSNAEGKIKEPRRPGERPGRNGGPQGANRALAASVVLHALLTAWVIAYVVLPDPEPPVRRRPMKVMAQVDQPDQVTNEESNPQIVDPPTEAAPDEEPPRVISEPIEPAPWLRPMKAEEQLHQRPDSGLAKRDNKRLSEKYRKDPEKVAAKVPTEKAKKADNETVETETAKAAPPAPAFRGASKKPGFCPRPVYPRRALRRRLEGRVTYLVDVGPDGRVLSMQLEKSSGHDILDRAARDAIKTWQFEPARRGDRQQRDRVRVPITFSIPRR